MPDYSIAMQNTMPQIQSPNELMANAYTLQNAKQANQLSQMKMDEYTRGLAETSQIKNALTRLNPASPTYRQDRQNAFALQGPEGLKTLAAIEREEAQTATVGVEATGKKVTNLDAIRKHSAKTYQDIIGRPSDANVTALYEDAVDSGLYPPEALVGMKQRSQQILSVPAPIDPITGKPDYSLRQQHIMQMNLEAKELMGKTGKSDIGGSIQNEITDPITGKVTVTGTTAKTISPDAQLKASIDQLKASTAQAKATQTQQAKTSVATAGQATISELANKLSGLYDKLDEGGGIVSTKMREGSNVGRAISGSYLGRATGHVLGSENQRIRESIENTRPLLLQAIKSATGMSAKQMDSNVELKMYLMAATDPTKSLESNKEALATLVRLYGIGGVGVANGGDVAAPAAPVTPARKTKDQLDYEAFVKAHSGANKR
jgi:hypothetical protein